VRKLFEEPSYFNFSTCFGQLYAHHKEKHTVSMRHWYFSLCYITMQFRIFEVTFPSDICVRFSPQPP